MLSWSIQIFGFSSDQPVPQTAVVITKTRRNFVPLLQSPPTLSLRRRRRVRRRGGGNAPIVVLSRSQPTPLGDRTPRNSISGVPPRFPPLSVMLSTRKGENLDFTPAEGSLGDVDWTSTARRRAEDLSHTVRESPVLGSARGAKNTRETL